MHAGPRRDRLALGASAPACVEVDVADLDGRMVVRATIDPADRRGALAPADGELLRTAATGVTTQVRSSGVASLTAPTAGASMELIDDIIDPTQTRAKLTAALAAPFDTHELLRHRAHDNSPF